MSDFIESIIPSRFKNVNINGNIVKVYIREFAYQPMRGWDYEPNKYAIQTLEDLSQWDRDADLAKDCKRIHQRIERLWGFKQQFPYYIGEKCCGGDMIVYALTDNSRLFWWDSYHNGLNRIGVARKIKSKWVLTND